LRTDWRTSFVKAVKALEADVVVPVPLHRIRRRERGFNQAELDVKMTCQAALSATSGHTFGEKAASSG
jgi:predicted amidophosphoribosyltransferase